MLFPVYSPFHTLTEYPGRAFAETKTYWLTVLEVGNVNSMALALLPLADYRPLHWKCL